MKKTIALVFFAAGLSACGWQVRGSLDMPKQLSNMYISASDTKGPLITELRQLLKTNRVSLAENSADANYSLYLLEETKDRRTAGVGGDELSSAYEITLKANYEIRLKNSNQSIKDTAISIRNFNYNAVAINSATQEELLLDQEMRRDLAQQILRRMSSVIANPPADSAKTTKASKHIAPVTGEKSDGKTAP